MKLLSCLKIEFKVLLKSKLLYIVVILAVLHNYMVFKDMIEMSQPLNMLITSGYSIQAMIFGFIIIGIHMNKKENDGNMIEILRGINSSIFIKMLAKAVVVLICVSTYLVINFIMLILMYRTTYIEFYVDSFKYIILFWGIPFFIATLIGYLIANVFKGKVMYVVAFFTWILMTPLNEFIFVQLGLLGFEQAFELNEFLCLTESNPQYLANKTYGLNIESYQFYKRIFIMSIVLILNIVAMVKKKLLTKEMFKILLIGTCGIALITGIATSREQQVLNISLNNKNSLNKKDYVYYKDVKTQAKYKENVNVLKYEMDLNIENTLKNDVNIELENISTENVERVHFLLYHDLKIKEVSIGGERLEFQRDGDNLFIELGKSIKPNEKCQIKIKYKGVTSPRYFANKRAIHLPNTYAWYPIISKYDSVMSFYGINNGLWSNYIKPNNEVEYKIELKDNEDIYTNLNKKSDNVIEGSSKEGIYLIKGKNVKDKVGNIEYIHSFNDKKEELEGLNKKIESAIGLINKDLDLENKIERVIILDYGGYAERTSNRGFWANGTIAIPYDLDMINTEIRLMASMVSSITNKNLNIDSSNYENLQLFDFAYSSFIEVRLGKNIEETILYEFREDIKNSLEFLIDRGINVDELLKTTNKLLNVISNKEILEREKIQLFKKEYEKLRMGEVKIFK